MFVSLCACLRDTNDLKLVFCLHFPTLLCRLLLYRWPTLLNYIVNDSSSLMMFAVSWAKKWVNAGLGVFGRVRFRLRQRGLPEKPKLWLGRRINEDRNRHSVKETKNSLSSEMQQVTFLCKIILTSKSSRGCSFQLFSSSSPWAAHLSWPIPKFGCRVPLNISTWPYTLTGHFVSYI